MRSKSLGTRIVDNADLIVGTFGVLFVLTLMGFPILRQTTTIQTTNPFRR